MLHSVLVLSFLWHFLSIVLCNGALIYNIADIPNITFDFIIIGGRLFRLIFRLTFPTNSLNQAAGLGTLWPTGCQRTQSTKYLSLRQVLRE